MDAIRVSKVEGVAYTRSGTTTLGTVHLTAHHLIFRYNDSTVEESWVPYPLISLVTRLPQTLKGQSPLTVYTRTFDNFTLTFSKEAEAVDVFESVKELTVATSVTQLYAFFYTPNPPLPASEGWSMYSPKEEFGRMGIGSRTNAWRFSNVNHDYSFCSTYPAQLVVPARISDTTLQYASRYRSKCRIPVLSYLHWANLGSITRSSQPMVGLAQNRSVQDEKLIEAIFQSHHSLDGNASSGTVYGATSTNLIIDARPTTNAVANTAKGAGTENMDHYKEAKKAYVAIDNIHVMRECLGKVTEALREADALLASINNDLPNQITNLATLDRQALRRTGWLRHICTILEGAVLIAKNVHVNSSHVLIHCSDGWDRTSQLSALSQLCLDPYYRTIRGFEILIEKDWLSFGHKFLDRCGHLSSEKFFVSSNDNAAGADAAQAFIASVQNRFGGPHHLKETSPVFHQFLDAVRQIQRQFPERFEFNERFLRQLYYHLYSCQFGTFLFNCERDRRASESGSPPCDRTISAWDFFNSPAEMEKNLNPTYDPSLDDPSRRTGAVDMGVLLPNPKNVRFWGELFGRTDEEVNGRIQSRTQEVVAPVVVVETVEEDVVVTKPATPLSVPLPPSPPKSPSPALPTSAANPPGSASWAGTPGLAGFVQDLSSSLPAMPKNLPFKADGFMTGPNPAAPKPSPSRSPTSPVNRRPPEYLTGGGVKSMWGKLSSNASAAFSVVQDAYTGATTGNPDASPERTAELRSRETLSSWGETASSTVPSRRDSQRQSSLATSNPWSSQEARSPVQSDPYANPWGASNAKSTGTMPSRGFSLAANLPADPTIAHPLPKSTTRPSSGQVRKPTTQPNPLITQVAPTADIDDTASTNLDPLGVGLS
ncbi:phosphatases II [Pluteus cervinus]|uniref:Phosphatases II n=1 Tax=Pluteus cervinus TaxID=181527 RepID=A0ACD3BGU6_9AGAR|nr:phosphatases II [Pluteus cervinus]